MEKLQSDNLDNAIDNLTDKIIREVNNINDKCSLKNVSAFKKILDSLDKLILLKEKLSNLKKTELNDSGHDENIKNRAIIEDYLSGRSKNTHV